MKKRFLPLLLCLVLLLSACGGTASGAQQPAPEPVQEPTDSLTVYISDSSFGQYINQLRREFEKRYPDVTLEIITNDLVNDTEEASKLSAELAAGRGPDLYIGSCYEFKDFNKVLRTGVFCDLTPYLENMEHFDRSDYVENIFDAGIYQGKICFVPLTWNYPGFVTTQEALDKAGIDAEVLGTYSGLMQTARSFSDAHNGNSAFFETKRGESFWEYAGVDYLDYDALETSVDTPEFREMIDAYKLIYAQDWTGPDPDENHNYAGADVYSLQNGDHIFSNCGGWGSLNLDRICSQFNGFTGRETALLMPFPTLDGKISARLQLIAAINANSKNKANAANLLELLLQEDLQKDISVYSIPVQRDALRRGIIAARQLRNGGYDLINQENVVLATLKNITVAEENYLVEKLSYVDRVYVDSSSALWMIFSDMEPYFKDEQSYETCLQKLQLDLEIYISE